MAQQSTMLKIIPMICRDKKKKSVHFQCITHASDFSLLLTHHDSSDADAHVPDDEEFTVEEHFDARLTVLQSTNTSQAAFSPSEPGCFDPQPGS